MSQQAFKPLPQHRVFGHVYMHYSHIIIGTYCVFLSVFVSLYEEVIWIFGTALKVF